MDSEILDFIGCWYLAFVTNVQATFEGYYLCVWGLVCEKRIELGLSQGPIHIHASCAKNETGRAKKVKQTNKQKHWIHDSEV